MFKKIFTQQQLSLFLQVGILINIIGLFLDLIIYHYFPYNNFMKILADNCNNASILIVCTIIISQALILFLKKHTKLRHQYPLATITITTCIGIFLVWILTIENDIEGKFIIFYSTASRFDHSSKVIFIIATITMLLIIDLYRTIENPTIINDRALPEVIRSSIQTVIRKHLLVLIFVYGIIHFTKIHKFSVAILNYSRSTLLFNLTLLEILIPISWLVAIGYYLYHKYNQKLQSIQ